ncbi:MAG TPA: hypothetical protein VIJ68_02535 [Candidatus Saccharimonadales bacterium]
MSGQATLAETPGSRNDGWLNHVDHAMECALGRDRTAESIQLITQAARQIMRHHGIEEPTFTRSGEPIKGLRARRDARRWGYVHQRVQSRPIQSELTVDIKNSGISLPVFARVRETRVGGLSLASVLTGNMHLDEDRLEMRPGLFGTVEVVHYAGREDGTEIGPMYDAAMQHKLPTNSSYLTEAAVSEMHTALAILADTVDCSLSVQSSIPITSLTA